MTNEEFEAIASTTNRMEQRAKHAAHMILVERATPADAARAITASSGRSFSRQAANRAAQRIEAAYIALQGVPEDWECITACLPPEQARAVREIERQARREAGLTTD